MCNASEPAIERYPGLEMPLLWQPFPMLARRRAQAWRYQPSFRRPAHFHDEPELNLVAHGTATFVVGHRRVEMVAGSLIWYPAGLDHYLEAASDDLELYVVGFRPDLLAAYAREHGAELDFALPPQHLVGKPLQTCAEVFGQAPASSDDGAVEHRLVATLGALARAAAPPKAVLSHRAAALLQQDPSLRRDALARKLARNRGDLSRWFRSTQGLSLAEYRNRLQTLKLIALLELGSRNLTRAALDAGFGSYSRCHHVVRALLGAAPSDLLDDDVRRARAERFEPMTD